ncbi:MAG: PLP-dependent aminotransferase family protein [Clostridiales bacterium]|nr:PLP-dependent aminotransferase family protein [Clostridiales bacterium]
MKKYTKLYNLVKNMILTGELQPGDKVPSVRKAAKMYNVSLTTVQSAYFELCADGYIIAHSKSGYFVSSIVHHQPAEEYKNEQNNVRYDLSGGIADPESFDFSLWQRYIKSALRQSDRLLSYSQPKGEYDLRSAIAQYIKEKRNVITSPDRIIIGAGVQPLLHILCSLLDKNLCVSFPDKSFALGMGVFSDYGFDIHTRDKDADVIYVSPSHMTRWGDVMPIKRRLELVDYSQKHHSLVIEDDYENEFLYNVKPTPSLYALGKGNIIYIGSFSAMLLPGIRISFMVLTKELTEKYNQNAFRYAQTAGKTEQIALCSYIRDGHIRSQTRKIRRLYSAKTKTFAGMLQQLLPNAEIEIGENTLQIILATEWNRSPTEFEKAGLRVFTEKYQNNRITLVLSPSGIPNGELEQAAQILADVILSHK